MVCEEDRALTAVTKRDILLLSPFGTGDVKLKENNINTINTLHKHLDC